MNLSLQFNLNENFLFHLSSLALPFYLEWLWHKVENHCTNRFCSFPTRKDRHLIRKDFFFFFSLRFSFILLFKTSRMKSRTVFCKIVMPNLTALFYFDGNFHHQSKRMFENRRPKSIVLFSGSPLAFGILVLLLFPLLITEDIYHTSDLPHRPSLKYLHLAVWFTMGTTDVHKRAMKPPFTNLPQKEWRTL